MSDLVEQLKKLQRRIEPISGQNFSYVKLDDVLATIEAALAAMPQEPVAKGEASYQAYREAMRKEFADEPADLPAVLRMLDRWGPEALPANEDGQVHFARSLLDSAAESIRKHLASPAQGATAPAVKALEAAYDKVKLWPEKRMPGVDVSELGEGFSDLLHLRNLVGEFIAFRSCLTDAQPAVSSEEETEDDGLEEKQ